MIFSKLKISTKLVISSAVFLIPIGVMLFFICSITVRTIQKSADEYAGITTIKPAVTVMQNLPEYFNVYLGLRQGDLRSLDEQITGALRSLDRGRYGTMESGLPNLSSEWEILKRLDKNDAEIYQKYLDFSASLTTLITRVGESSRLSLVSAMDTYYVVASSLSSLPEASTRVISLGNLLRKNIFGAEKIIEKWNNDLADAQAQGRRLTARPFGGNPGDITFTMIATQDFQPIFNSRPLFDSDKQRNSFNLNSAMDEGKMKASELEALTQKLERYRQTCDSLSALYGRMFGFNISNPCTAAEFLEALSFLNNDVCQLWAETVSYLELRIIDNTHAARRSLILYLIVVFVSLGLAIGFVIFIALDINRSVRMLKRLFKGLNENDLTMSLQNHSRDEFGELMTAFNGFLNILRSTFGSFKQSAQLVSDSVFDISSSSKEITTTANEQSASVSEIVSTMEGSKNLSEQIAIKTAEVAQLANQTQELSSKGAELRESNQGMMEDILKQNQKIISEIRNLSDMIIRISEAIRIIDSIADQTKLIAFNASLEASSSGEAGARFSVVASEIRRFADNVVESTKEIKQKIEEVQGASQALISEANSGSKQIEIGYEKMSEQKVVFEHIVDNSQNVATRSQQISNLSKQQELASSQIFIALKEISAGVNQFVIATSSSSKIADSLNGMSEELKGKVEKYRTET